MADVEVRGRYLLGDDSPAQGDVTFAPRVAAANDSGDGNILIGRRVRVTLDDAGEFTVTLQASDDPVLDPTGWTYQVVEELSGIAGRWYDIEIPTSAVAAGIDLWTVAPAPPSAGDPTAFVTLTAFAAMDARVDALEASAGSDVDSVDGRSGAVSLADLYDPAGAAADAQAAAEAAAASTYLRPRDQPTLARGAVIFCIDDCKTQAAPLIAVHDALNQKAVLGVCSAKVGTAGFLNSAQVLAAFNNGHELANHSDTHANYTAITAAQRRVETDNCQAFLTALTGVTPESFIYPQGGWSATTDREMYGVFRNWRATLSPATNLPNSYPLGDTFPRYYSVDVGDPANYARMQDLIRQAAVTPIVVSSYVHYTDDVGVITTAQYQSLAQLASDLGVPAVLSRDVIGGLSRIPDPSFESPGIPSWFFTNTGAATGGQFAATPDAGLAGTNVLRMTATGPDSSLAGSPVVVTPGTTVRVSGRFKFFAGNLTTNDFAVRMKFRAWDEAAVTGPVVYPAMPAIGVWGRFETDYVVPAAARFAWLELLTAPGVVRSGTMYVDHVDVRPSDQGGLG